MPTYAYKCSCGATKVEIRKMDERNKPIPCPVCIEAMERDISAEHVSSTNMPWKPIRSNSLSVGKRQVAAHRKKFPNIKIEDDGTVMVNSLAEQRDINRQLGYTDRNRYY